MVLLKHVPTLLSQTWPPSSKFSVDQIPDLSGRVFIVTGELLQLLSLVGAGTDVLSLGVEGGNAGVGYETVKVRRV